MCVCVCVCVCVCACVCVCVLEPPLQFLSSGRARGEKYNGHPVSRCYAGSSLASGRDPFRAHFRAHGKPRLLHGRLGNLTARPPKFCRIPGRDANILLHSDLFRRPWPSMPSRAPSTLAKQVVANQSRAPVLNLDDVTGRSVCPSSKIWILRSSDVSVED